MALAGDVGAIERLAGAAGVRCPCCGDMLHPGLTDWHWQCDGCGYEASTLDAAINDSALEARIDEGARAQALNGLRMDNCQRLLAIIAPHLPASAPGHERKRVLDVGAGQGWFVRVAAQQHEVTGIEPDEQARAAAAGEGVALQGGFFPQCLNDGDVYEAIVFNDSLEHMPDLHQALAAAHKHLVPGGLLVLNLPDAGGALYGISRQLARTGWGGPFARMWQLGLPSPHLHYFRPANLEAAAAAHGMRPVCRAALEVLRYRGLYPRIAYARPASPVSSALLWLAMLPLVLLSQLAHSDIMVLVLRRD